MEQGGNSGIENYETRNRNVRQATLEGAHWAAVVAPKIVFKQTTNRNLKAKALGCSSGWWCRWLAERRKPGGRVGMLYALVGLVVSTHMERFNFVHKSNFN